MALQEIFHGDESSGNRNLEDRNSEGQSLDELIDKAVEAASKGENVEQLLEVILVSLPANAKEKARKRFAAALAKRGLRQPSGDADIPSRAALTRMRNALATSTRQMMERIALLMRSRPDVAARIKQAGMALTQSGVAHDKVTVSESDLGNMAPGATTGKSQQDRGSAR